jgi:two-component sensor histidine kinase
MKCLPDRMVEVVAWRFRHPPVFRWLIAAGLFALALLVRVGLGRLHGANPVLAFYPVILLTATFLGWREAAFILILSVSVGAYVYLPPDLYLMPFAWLLVGSLNILIIATLKTVAQQLLLANDHQRVLFAELQHRVANTLQSTGGSIELARRQMSASPSRAAAALDEASRRVWAAADVHRLLHDPAMVRTALGSILHDAVASVIDPQRTRLVFDIDQPDLSLDQMSTITMIIIECAHNAQKHVFENGLGSMFSISLKAPCPGRGMLVIRDDGPGIGATPPLTGDQKLGQKLIQRLAANLGATLSLTPGSGTEIVIAFPLEAVGDSP